MTSLKKGFTLIELLVVITIIGILATGAVQTFTSQIQKARDTTRVSDITALRGGLEQFYQDGGEYPDKGTAFSGVTLYVPKLPTDPKSEQSSGTSTFEYAYNVSADSNSIDNQEFEISAHFENGANTTAKAGTDGGDDPVRLEFWIDVNDTTEKPTVIAWEDTTADLYECVTPSGWAWADCDEEDNPMIIK